MDEKLIMSIASNPYFGSIPGVQPGMMKPADLAMLFAQRFPRFANYVPPSPASRNPMARFASFASNPWNGGQQAQQDTGMQTGAAPAPAIERTGPETTPAAPVRPAPWPQPETMLTQGATNMAAPERTQGPDSAGGMATAAPPKPKTMPTSSQSFAGFASSRGSRGGGFRFGGA